MQCKKTRSSGTNVAPGLRHIKENLSGSFHTKFKISERQFDKKQKFQSPEIQPEILAGSDKVGMVLARLAAGTAVEREVYVIDDEGDLDEDMTLAKVNKEAKEEIQKRKLKNV